MKSISMVEFRQQAESILRKVEKGQSFAITYRGKAVARLEPIAAESTSAADPFFSLSELASEDAASLSNADMDRIIYAP